MSTFLIVEDELLVGMMVEDMLVEFGHSVLHNIQDFTTAIEVAEKGKFDMALLDLNLRGQSSLPIANVLMERGIPFVFATGYGRGVLDQRFANVEVLAKPFLASDLAKAITNCLTIK